MTDHHRLLLFSCGQRAILDNYREQIFGAGVDVSKLKSVCIPTAGAPYAYEDKQWQRDEMAIFSDFGLQLETLDLEHATKDHVQESLKDADVIYVTGGNTYFLLEHIKRTDCGAVLNERLDNGTLYIGCSAGGIVVGPDIGFIEDMDNPSVATLENTKALGLIDFQILPHIDGDHFKEAIQAIIPKLDQNTKTIGLRDSQALFINGPYMEIFE